MQWYEGTSKKLEVGYRYSHQDLIRLLKSDYPQMSESSYHWAVCGMLKSGNLTKVARNVYVVQNEREKPMYRPAYSDLAAKLISQVSDKYPSVRFTVFETALMNDFLNHLVALNTVFIQAEKDVSIFVFRHLRELGYAHLLYKPKKADYALYWEKDCNGVQREHNKKLNNGLPILHKVPPKRDYGRYFCIMAEKGGTSHGGLTEKLSPFFHAKKQEVNAYGR